MKLFGMLIRRVPISVFAAMPILLLTLGVASAGVPQPINIDSSGGQLTGTLMWTGPGSFELRNMSLTDTTCDSQPVFFSVSFNGHDGPRHTNNSGCKSTTTFPTLKGADTPHISALTINVCRATSVPECDKLIFAPA